MKKKQQVMRGAYMDTTRLEGSVNIKRMADTNVVMVGVGGASGILEDLTRCGVGKITAIDFDKVDASNLCTQGYTVDDIGQFKVRALGKHLKSINPSLAYISVKRNFLEMTEDEVETIMSDADILLFMTDDFFAQARGNLVALKLKKPALFAIVYEKARCAEITFTIPEKTPACHRCATSSGPNADRPSGVARPHRHLAEYRRRIHARDARRPWGRRFPW